MKKRSTKKIFQKSENNIKLLIPTQFCHPENSKMFVATKEQNNQPELKKSKDSQFNHTSSTKIKLDNSGLHEKFLAIKSRLELKNNIYNQQKSTPQQSYLQPTKLHLRLSQIAKLVLQD